MRHHSATRNASILLACLFFLGVSSLFAEEFLPLEIGNYWSYLAEDGMVETKVISEQATIFGQDVFVIEYTESSQNLGLRNFWTGGEDGDVFLHGFNRGWGFIYDPPIQIVDAPLYVGKTWTTEFAVYALPDTSYQTTWEVTYVVLEEGVYQVGAGSFPGYGLGTVEPEVGLGLRQGFSLSGQVEDSAQRDADFWFSDGVGEIQYDTDHLYMLESYSGGTVATEPLAWDGVKALFR